ncbi:7SK snRNA methylphosphate capping enzyme-like [Gigantopelta aegis]|uniref:7SK snRNA methylphosphate capping enzyme-like n=1 Tax=Gigantopelta aegis TaxID=1735272 RepID=UPI001B88D11F|nr:7SK snRNA methylphosphate capping enzyme-like [Gigantopelta aegis]
MSVGVKTPTRSQFEHAEFLCGEIVSSPKEIPPSSSDGLDNTKRRMESTCTSLNRTYLNVGGASRFQSTSSSSLSRNDRHDCSFRKRRYSQPQKSLEASAFGSLRRRRLASQVDLKFGEKGANIILPTRFLLGGNINDPLNLNGLYEDDAGRILNERTPESSPLPTPSHRSSVEVKIPPNITDPLNLNSDDFDNKNVKKRKRSYYNRHKRKENVPQVQHSTALPGKEASDGGKDLFNPLKIDIDTSNEISDDIEEDLSLDIQAANLNKSIAPNKIVSPVIPQASPKMRRRRMTISECRAEISTDTARVLFRSSSSPDNNKISPFRKNKKQFTSPRSVSTKPKFSSKPKFVHGNYNRYYGYRNPKYERDHRMDSFDSEWFECKDVLDVGCNVGSLTLTIARDFRPNKIVGMDIDGTLIKAARKNIRQYLSCRVTDPSKYPVSCLTNYGPISAPPVGDAKSISTFPSNIMFIQGDVVLEDDRLLEYQSEEYDMILALSITKWIHLNHGDAGLKRVFKRIYKQLRPGGKLILEPQPWSSYKKRKKLTEQIYTNYLSIELKPDAFRNYLLTEVGFSMCEVIGVPFNKSKGFRRPLQLYTKTDTISNTPNIPDTDEHTQHTSDTDRIAQHQNTRTVQLDGQTDVADKKPIITEASAPTEMVDCNTEASAPAETLDCKSEASAPTKMVDCNTQASAPTKMVDCNTQASAPTEMVDCNTEASAPAKTLDCNTQASAPTKMVGCNTDVNNSRDAQTITETSASSESIILHTRLNVASSESVNLYTRLNVGHSQVLEGVGADGQTVDLDVRLGNLEDSSADPSVTMETMQLDRN